MNDFLLKSSIHLANVRDAGIRSLAKGSEAMDARYRTSRENGDIVQTILIIAMFVLICVVVGKILTDNIKNQATDVGACISNINDAANKCANFGGR